MRASALPADHAGWLLPRPPGAALVAACDAAAAIAAAGAAPLSPPASERPALLPCLLLAEGEREGRGRTGAVVGEGVRAGDR